MVDIQKQVATIKPEQILGMVLRRRWVIAIPLCITLTIGVILVSLATRIYSATTTILIQPQRVPRSYVESVVTTDINRRISTISQQILSRSNLEKIIKEFGLYEESNDMFLEDKVSDLRENRIKINTSRSNQGTEAFSISFEGSNPKRIMMVVNTLATYFMDENLKAREIQAMGTSEFLESELDKIKAELEGHEKSIAEYRTRYMGELPEELQANLRTLDRLQTQQTDATNALREANNSLTLLRSQIARIKETAQESPAAMQALTGEEPVAISEYAQAQQMYETGKRNLEELLLKYTIKHPEVIKLQKKVDKLKNKLEEVSKEEENSARDVTDDSRPLTVAANLLFQHELQEKQTLIEISRIKKGIKEIERQMKVYERRVEETPKREQELQSIQRDYNNIRDNYNSILARRLEAELSVNMEKKQKGEQFRILDHATKPEKPISPNVFKYILFSMAAGLGISGAMIFLLEFVNPAIWTEGEIESGLGLPILSSIPLIKKPGDKIKKLIERVSYSMISLYALMVLGIFMIFHLKGIDKTISFIKLYINI